ncbi:MAG TPA: hypothetical protein VGD47_09740 [Steroidobacteraceae bacterium]
MKTRTKLPIGAAAAALAACGIAQARDCSESTLEGLYVFSATGFNIVQGAAQPKAVTEFIRFNGNGTLTVPAATVSLDGVVIRSPPNGTGSYTVSSDCTGSLQFNDRAHASFDLFIAADGHTIYMNQTGGALPGVLQGRAESLSD